MLAYVQGTDRRGANDLLLAGVAVQLQGRGWRLAGAVQANSAVVDGASCDMHLHVLGSDRVVRISQNLGPLSRGCRLDADGLEQAVGLVAAALQPDADPLPHLLILNKFGKHEGMGRGFRPLIGQALALGVPVLTAVTPGNLAGFRQFACGMAQALPPDPAALLDWCLARQGCQGAGLSASAARLSREISV